MKRNEKEFKHDLYYGSIYVCQFLLIFVLALFLAELAEAKPKKAKSPDPPEGFVLKKVGDHYEPLLHYKEFVIMPGTNIKFGAYEYILHTTSKKREYDEIPIIGFLIDNKKFYYVQEPQVASSCSDAHYGNYKDYFVTDGFGYGASHNRTMYLFKYDEHSVKLLDVIGPAYVGSYGMDFQTAYPENIEKKYGYLGSKHPTLWTDIKDIDGDGNPEINLIIFLADRPEFELYLEIVNDRLRVDLNPELYRTLFENIVQKHQGKSKPNAYYVYGYLSRNIDLKEIEIQLERDKELKERINLIRLLENVSKWNSAFHDLDGEKYELKQLQLDGR